MVKVKGNQPRLKAAILQTVTQTQPLGYDKQVDTCRGRKETRETYLYSRLDNMDSGWQSICRIIYVRRNVLWHGNECTTDSYYVSDLSTNDARYMSYGIRSHWFIENKLHYVKDVIMREDSQCTKNKKAAANLALLRDFVFNILKSQSRSIKYASEIFANYSMRKLLNAIIRT